MLTKDDFLERAGEIIANDPILAPAYRAGDPRLVQPLSAMATMLAMFSAQLEVAMEEPFDKVRDATVLADAAMRGVIRKAVSGRVLINAKNNGSSPFLIETGRVVIDSNGLPYIVETSVTINAGATGTFYATQVKHESFAHTISESIPFYSIEIPEASDDSLLCGIAVSDADGKYEYRERYVNTWPGERVFHVESDDMGRIYVRFGQSEIVGVQHNSGHTVTVTVSRTAGEISPKSSSPFSFEYLQSPNESQIELSLNSLVYGGQNQPDMATMRDLIRYPSIYNHSAVFLGEFDFVVRRAYTNLRFLSVWNETIEEAVRGADVDNINTLFVACLSYDDNETVLSEPDPENPVSPTIIAEINLTETQKGIRRVIEDADNSYRVRFLTPVRSKIQMTIVATVSTAYIASDVRSQIIEAIIDEYGEAQPGSRRGIAKPLYKRVYALLKEKIPALTDANADVRVTIADLPGLYRPELWRYVSTDSLSVTVTTDNVLPPAWGI